MFDFQRRPARFGIYNSLAKRTVVLRGAEVFERMPIAPLESA